MLLASSIRYGGLLIEAGDCDYNSFKHLGLLCPICKRSVFLVAPTQRQAHNRKNKAGESIAVKGSSVVSHFAHHPEVDRSTVDDCELRSAKITLIQRLQAETTSRNQRRKILQSHCWKIIKTSLNLPDCEEVSTLLRSTFECAQMNRSHNVKKLYDLLIESLCAQWCLPSQLEHTQSTLEEGMMKWSSDILARPERMPKEIRDAMVRWGQTLELKMQAAIVKEAMAFTSTKMQRPILIKIIESAIYKWLMARTMAGYEPDIAKRVEIFNLYYLRADMLPNLPDTFGVDLISSVRELIALDRVQFESLFYFVRDDVAQSFSMIDWAGEFERLDNSVQNLPQGECGKAGSFAFQSEGESQPVRF